LQYGLLMTVDCPMATALHHMRKHLLLHLLQLLLKWQGCLALRAGHCLGCQPLLACRLKQQVIRGLCCLVWRCLVQTCCQNGHVA